MSGEGGKERGHGEDGRDRGRVSRGQAARAPRCMACLLGVGQHVVRHRHQRVLFAKKASVFADKTQPIHVGVNADAQMTLSLHNGLGQIAQMAGQRLRVVRKMSSRLAVHRDHLHAQCLEKHRHSHAAAR